MNDIYRRNDIDCTESSFINVMAIQMVFNDL